MEILRTAVVACKQFLLLAVSLLPLAGCSQRKDPGSEAAPPPMTLTPKSDPLNIGDALPELRAEGWLNSSPPTVANGDARLVLVDVWASWCPYCRYGAPDLVRLFEKYKGKGVAFVSVTNMPRVAVERFVAEFAVPWPAGYGAPGELVAALRVNSGMPTPGYEIAPTVYLVGPDGRVVRTDSQGRLRHVDTKEWARNLDQAIADALAAGERRPEKSR